MTTPNPLPLDADGLLPDGAVALPTRAEAYTVFAQQSDARLDASAWERNAKQFFDSELRLTRPKQYGAAAPTTDGAHIMLTPKSRPAGMRNVFFRPRTDADMASADEAERAAGGGGMALLAKRCRMVVLVTLASREDEVALRLAAIIASVVLGPILAPDAPELFGVRTARSKLAAFEARAEAQAKATASTKVSPTS
jgi:hypothetical protein